VQAATVRPHGRRELGVPAGLDGSAGELGSLDSLNAAAESARAARQSVDKSPVVHSRATVDIEYVEVVVEWQT
jgi:hypothetical protein